MTDTSVTPDPAETDRCADIAAALHKLALRFTDLIGTGVPVPFIQLAIQPGRHGDDESVAAAVDTLTSALLGHAGSVQQMSSGTFHYNNGEGAEPVDAVSVRIFNSVTPEFAARREAAAKLAEREAELERLRAEVAELRAAAAPAVPNYGRGDEARRDRRTCVDPGDQEHDHESCRDVVAEEPARGRPLISDETIAEAAAMEERDRLAGGPPWEVPDHPENSQPGGWHHGQIR